MLNFSFFESMKWMFSWDSWSNEHFWYYTKRMFAWFLWIFAIMSVSDLYLVNDAAAEITFNQNHTFTASGGIQDGQAIANGAAGGTTVLVALDHLTFDFTTYKIITNLTLPSRVQFCTSGPCVNPGADFATRSTFITANDIVTKGTPVTATINGQFYASGEIYWQKNPPSPATTDWLYVIIFDTFDVGYANSLTGVKTINLAYDQSIFYSYVNNYSVLKTFGNCQVSGTILNGYVDGGSCGLFSASGGGGFNNASQITFGWESQRTVNLQFNNASTTFGWVNLTKNNANERLLTTNSTGSVIYDATSTSDDNQYTSKTTGINASVQDQASLLWWNNTLVLSSGLPCFVACQQGQTPPPSVLPVGSGGSPSGQIQYDFSSSIKGSPYGVITNITNDNFSALNTYLIYGYTPGGNLISGFPIIFNAQNFSTGRMWSFDIVGTYNTTLRFCGFSDLQCNADLALLAVGLGSPPDISETELIDTATILVNPTIYNYSVVTDQANYFNGQVINFTVNNPSPVTIYMSSYILTPSIGLPPNVLFSSIPIPPGVTIKNYTIKSTDASGFYTVDLYQYKATDSNLGSGQVAFDRFNITSPTAGSNIQSILWDANPVFGLNNNLHYSANANASTITVFSMLPGSNSSTVRDTFGVSGGSANTVQYLMDTTGLWSASIVDGGNSSNITWSNVTVFSSTPSSTCFRNLPNYVCWNNASYFVGDPFTIDFKATDVPTGIVFADFNLRLLIFDPDKLLVVNRTICSIPLVGIPSCSSPPITGYFSDTFNQFTKPGKWNAILMRDGTSANKYLDGSPIASSFATVFPLPGVAGGGINNTNFMTTRTCDQGDTVCVIDNWTALFGLGVNDTSRFLFAITVILLITAGGYSLTHGYLIGFIPFAFFTYISYVPRWFAVVLVIIIAIMMRVFR